MDLTYGGRAVGLDHNPSGDARVNKIKSAFADIIDDIVGPGGPTDMELGERSAQTMIAVRQIQSASLWAVKALTWEDEPAPATPSTSPGPIDGFNRADEPEAHDAA